MKWAIEPAVFDDNGNLKLKSDETLLAKKKLSCRIYFKGFLVKKNPQPTTIFSTDEGIIYRTNQRIICTNIQEEGIVEDDVCVEVVLDEIIVCIRHQFWLTLGGKESNRNNYYIDLRPLKSAKEFLGEVLFQRLSR